MSYNAVQISRYLRRIRRQERLNYALILHYDYESGDLRPWFWPVAENGQRVTPSDLLNHRLSHQFRVPCCLCAYNTTTAIYTESAIYLAIQGEFSGEYVAGCATDSCGYLICLERMYSRRGLQLKKYPARNAESPPPARILRLPGLGRSIVSHGRQSERSLDIVTSIPVYARPPKHPEAVFDRLLRLDSLARPGLSSAQFIKLFAKCACGLIMTRRVFREHECAQTTIQAALIPPVNNVIIDLTSESDDSQSNIIDLTLD